ncbi:aldo/keto reductase [Caballeronia sp. INDeC2]|uniref:aldo/keto reductase n=1 Tax=Caballeronia sp. INDeC2 TaxID=2921747 RepID=UPI0020282E7E|nr:aldo/keto reductase [Caballeronia sp. INDeC2]
MKYRQVGASDLTVSEIGFGCGGNAGLMVRGDFDEQLVVVERALDLGVTYFDTAPDYGNGLAEENLGKVLKRLEARPVLNSKVEIRARDLDDVAGHVVRSTEATLRRLQVDHLDVLQIHNGPVFGAAPLQGDYYATLGIDHFTGPNGALEGLQSLVQAGKVRYVGFVCRGNDIDPVRQLLDTGVFSMINVSYTMLNPTPGIVCPEGLEVEKDGGAVLDFARDASCGAAAYSVLARGFLTDDSVHGLERHRLARSTAAYGERASGLQQQAAQVQFVARELGISLAQAAFRFVLGHTGVTTALGGFSSLAQLEELSAVSGMGPLPDDLLSRLDRVWRNNFATVRVHS